VIYAELRALALRQGCQLIIATHSEVIINSVDPRELCLMYGKPRPLADTAERALLVKSLGWLTNSDMMLAQEAPGVLYVEGSTDIAILREWARILDHPARVTLTNRSFWKQLVWENRLHGRGIRAEDHYNGICMVREDLPGLIIIDGDNKNSVPETPITGRGLQRLKWRRYEIESYLVVPAALARFISKQVGGDEAARLNIEDMMKYFEESYPPAFLKNPLEDLPFLIGTKAREDLIPPILGAAGIHGVEYTRFYEIAALMTREEIHPEVKEKLDAIQRAFNL
jgi:hypothetical protein